MLTVQMGLGRMGDEKLTAVRVRTSVGHREAARAVPVGVASRLVLKFVAGAAPACAGGVAALNHEIVNNPVKADPVIKAFTGQKDKVVDRLRRFLGKQVNFNCPPICFHSGRIFLVGVNLHGRGAVPLFSRHNYSLKEQLAISHVTS